VIVRSMCCLVLMVASSALSSSAAGAQQVMFAAGLPTELDSATQAALTRDVGLARARGLPVEPLMAKVREGRIKRAAPSRIRSAVAALTARLDSARAALGAASNASELVAGADALGAGADMASLRTVRGAAGARDVAASLGALAQLVATGVPIRRATSYIVELLRRDTAPGRVLAFGNDVEADVGAGVPAEESATFRMRAIETQQLNSGNKVTVAGPATGDALSSTTPPGRGARPIRKP
jgi:hypothetical protein